jgi:exodeoxyribonuclease-3
LTKQTTTLLSWNVNGIRAAHRKGFLGWLVETKPDILCLQETRAEETQLPATLAQPEGYHGFWNSSRRKKGYSGTALLTRIEPLDVQFGLGIGEFDQEGRTIIAQYPTFTLINCYFPNGGRDHSRVPFKLAFYDAFLEKCERLRHQGQGMIFCGDVNTAHQEIDLAHPKANQNTTGFLPEERAWIDRVVAAGYADTFRHFYPDLAGQYTWWSMPTRARERNVGWRLDYFFVAAELLDRVTDAFILPDVTGSDHCPVGLRYESDARPSTS